MTSTVVHQPRVAWDGARAFVRIAQTLQYEVFADQVRHRLGPEAFAQLRETHERLLDGLTRSGGDRHVTDVEAGKWRVRLEELLRARPDLAAAVLDLTALAPRP